MTYLHKFFGHLKNIFIHKYWVFKYCCQFGIPWQGITHDLSKFSPTEFFESVKYYQGDSSPIPACKKENGYSLAWQHHKGRNPHHYEYWTDNYDSGMSAIPIPSKYLLEMLADWFAAGRTYKGSEFRVEDEVSWWKSKKATKPSINPITVKVIDEIMNEVPWFLSLSYIRQQGGVKYIDKLYEKYSNTIESNYVNNKLKWEYYNPISILNQVKYWKDPSGRFELSFYGPENWKLHIDDNDFSSIGHSKIETVDELNALVSIYEDYNYRNMENLYKLIWPYMVDTGWKPAERRNVYINENYPNCYIRKNLYDDYLYDFYHNDDETELSFYSVDQLKQLIELYK